MGSPTKYVCRGEVHELPSWDEINSRSSHCNAETAEEYSTQRNQTTQGDQKPQSIQKAQIIQTPQGDSAPSGASGWNPSESVRRQVFRSAASLRLKVRNPRTRCCTIGLRLIRTTLMAWNGMHSACW